VITAAIVAATLHAAPPPADRAAGRRGAAYVAALAPGTELGAEADSVLALVAAGAPPGKHLARLLELVPAQTRTPGLAAKAALAVVAAGLDPHCAAGVDLVARIRAGYAAGVYGASVFEDSLAITALAGAGEPVPPAAVAELRRLRGSGGYGLSLSGGADDADDTGLALMALRAAGVPAADAAVRGSVRWLLQHRLPGAGWAGAAGSSTVSDSTALALRGLTAAGSGWPTGAGPALRRLQGPDGGFDASAGVPGSRVLATLDSTPALLRRTLPLVRRTTPGRPCG
jgi:hypothetical protein